MKVTYANAIGDALKEEMRRDGKVLIYGEDIAQFGNIFGITRGMLEEFGPKRVRNTPITETAIIGSAIGAAETGLRPCVELMYSDFTMMAAGNNRTTQLQRFRQRFMHKLVYFPDNNDGMYSCVGCGRCVEKCPQSLNIVKVIKRMGGTK